MSRGIDDLLRIMARLRDRERGCPWDVAQTFATIAPCTIEEAYEVVDAIDRADYADLREELGDLLLQVVFHARMAEEEKRFAFADVVESVCAKLIRRHPHVFAERAGEPHRPADGEQALAVWEDRKRQERADKGQTDTSALAGIARGLPEWLRALKLQKRGAGVGFEWPDAAAVLDKLHEEIAEVRAELDDAARIAEDDAAAWAANRARLADEVGDVLFLAVNLARVAKVDVSAALRGANAKYERRFRRMEIFAATEGGRLPGKTAAELNAYWNRAKVEEKTGREPPVGGGV